MGVIYCARNIQNDKLYIGQTIDFKHRKAAHISEARHSKLKTPFHNAIKKYGEDNFSWTILEDNVPNDELSDLEILYIDMFCTYLGKNYNCSIGGEGNLGY